LRPATDDDCEFSFLAKKAAQGPYIRALWGWDEDKQREFHLRDWREKRPDIIMLNDEAIGTMYAREEDGAIQVRQFFILPEHQNRGIGTELIRRVLDHADALGMVTKVSHLEGSRVKALYERLGFKSTDQKNPFFFMEREPRRRRK
jgi:GNAT superfamily N-acetyltransferase